MQKTDPKDKPRTAPVDCLVISLCLQRSAFRDAQGSVTAFWKHLQWQAQDRLWWRRARRWVVFILRESFILFLPNRSAAFPLQAQVPCLHTDHPCRQPSAHEISAKLGHQAPNLLNHESYFLWVLPTSCLNNPLIKNTQTGSFLSSQKII